MGQGEVRECVFRENTANDFDQAGGGLKITNGQVINCLFENNQSYRGGGIYCEGVMDPVFYVLLSYVTVANCTFVGNQATKESGALCYLRENLTMRNCIVWDCGPDPVSHNSYFSPTSGMSGERVSHCIIEGGFTPDSFSSTSQIPYKEEVFAILDMDPQFVDPANGDFHLQDGSPAIDYGTNRLGDAQAILDAIFRPIGYGPETDAPAEDLHGNARPQGAGFDLGVYESPFVNPPPVGDVDWNRVVNAVDVQLVINAALGLPVEDFLDPDINGDGLVNAVDVQLVINATLGKL